MDPILIPIRATHALILGILSGFCGLMLTGTVLTLGWIGARSGPGFLAGLCAGLGVLAYAVHSIGVSIRKPVALRMDAHGISGYYATPSRWIEIMQIETFSGRKGRRYLGFAFLNPDMVAARQSWFLRALTWADNPRGRYQIVIPEAVLTGTDVEQVAFHARALQSAA